MTRLKFRPASSLLRRREQRSERIPHSSFRHAVQDRSNTIAYSHTKDTHDTTSHNPPVIPDGALQYVRPGSFGYERRCDIAKRDEALGCRSGDEVERGGQNDGIEN